jgi:hypothetical protein
MNPVDQRVLGPVEEHITRADVPIVVLEVAVLKPVVLMASLLGRARAVAPTRPHRELDDMLSLRDNYHSDK